MTEFESNLNDLLVDVFNQILRFEEASIKSALESAVTVTEAHILEVIGRQTERITVSEIASILNISVPTITVALKKLEGKGFISKTASAEDGRRFIIGLTETGERIYRAHDLFHKKMVRDISRSLSDAEKDALLSGVKKLLDFFRGKGQK